MKFTCPFCRANDLNYQQVYCHICGRQLNWNDLNYSGRKCPQCGRNAPGEKDRYCRYCGSTLVSSSIERDSVPDKGIMDRWLTKYPSKWKSDVPRLDRLGQVISSRDPKFATLEEIARIVYWKRPGTGAKFLARNSNDDVRITTERAFGSVPDDFRVDILTHLEQVGIPMASAILRFVFPDRFGTVDWRNWYVLSHEQNAFGEDNELFEKPLLPRIGSVEKYSSIGITNRDYRRYISVLNDLSNTHPRTKTSGKSEVIQNLLERYEARTPAEIDMAIFSYSWDFIQK